MRGEYQEWDFSQLLSERVCERRMVKSNVGKIHFEWRTETVVPTVFYR